MNLEDKNVKVLLENEVISTLLADPNYFGQTIHHLQKEFFSDIGSSVLFETIKDHYQEFGEIPSLKDVILSHKNSDQQTKNLVKASIKEINSNIEPVHITLLIQQTELFIKDAIFTKALLMGADAMGSHNQDKKLESFALAEESVKVSLDSDFGIFVDEIDKRFDDYQAKHGLKLNIPSFDEIIGDGFTPKTLHLITAASGVGKSAMLCSFGVQFLQQGKDVVIISLEMAESEFYKRIDSNLFDVQIKDLPQIEKQVLKNKYNKLQDTLGNLVIKEFPAGGLTALGLQSYLEKLEQEKGIKSPVVMVDYLSLMSSDRLKATDNSYGYFKSVAEELRAVAQKMNLIMFTPMQLNRSAVNNLEADQGAISDSMGVYMAADSAFIISQTPDYKDQGKMRISYVKNRMSGQTRFFEIGYDYSHFRVVDKFRDTAHIQGTGDVSQELTNMGLDNDLKNIMGF